MYSCRLRLPRIQSNLGWHFSEVDFVVIFHKCLDVYRLSLDFVEIAADIAKHIPRGQSYLADQLRRSASSTVLNIGEGAGEFSKKEKARFYRMALRSATESASTID